MRRCTVTPCVLKKDEGNGSARVLNVFLWPPEHRIHIDTSSFTEQSAIGNSDMYKVIRSAPVLCTLLVPLLGAAPATMDTNCVGITLSRVGEPSH